MGFTCRKFLGKRKRQQDLSAFSKSHLHYPDTQIFLKDCCKQASYLFTPDLFSSVRSAFPVDILNFCLCLSTSSLAKECARTRIYNKITCSKKLFMVSSSIGVSNEPSDTRFFIDDCTRSTFITVFLYNLIIRDFYSEAFCF